MVAGLVVESSLLHPGLLVPMLLLASSSFCAPWYAVITWSYMPKSTPSNHLQWHPFQWNVLNKGLLLFVLFLSFFFKFLISHPVMLQPPCTLGQCVCCITCHCPDDIPVGLRNDDFSSIWVAVCKIFVGNSCLNLNPTFQISTVFIVLELFLDEGGRNFLEPWI